MTTHSPKGVGPQHHHHKPKPVKDKRKNVYVDTVSLSSLGWALAALVVHLFSRLVPQHDLPEPPHNTTFRLLPSSKPCKENEQRPSPYTHKQARTQTGIQRKTPDCQSRLLARAKTCTRTHDTLLRFVFGFKRFCNRSFEPRLTAHLKKVERSRVVFCRS
jgi:hypothetical protein